MAKGKTNQSMVKKTITITLQQANFIQDNTISLSKFVQKKNEELIAEKRGV